MSTLVRAASLQGYVRMAESVGVDARFELQRVGLSEEVLANPEALFPYVSQLNLLEHTALVGHCPDFGLRLAESQDAAILGPLAVLFKHAPTLGDALQLASNYLFVHSPAIKISVAPVPGRPQETDLVFGLEMPHLPPCMQTMEMGLGMTAIVIRQITQGRFKPTLALLPHARMGDKSTYARVLQCECRFEAGTTALRVPTSALLTPLPEHNPLLQSLAQSYIDQHFGAPNKVFSDRVRLIVRQFLGTRRTTQDDVASILCVHPRTLQRRLVEENERFENILDGVRQDLLLSLISRPQAPRLSQIALMLGYAEQAALTRACRRWFQCAPSQLLKRQKAPDHATTAAS